jgi:protein tyrosine/serine phosphatase
MRKFDIKQAINRKTIFLIVFLFIIGFFIVWEAGFKFNFFPKRFGVVEEGRIYRSGELSTWLIEKTLSKYNIKVIVCLTGDAGHSEDIIEKNVAAKLGIEKKYFLLKGNGTGDVNIYADAVAAICQAREKGKPVLIRCSAGAQRTGGVVAIYRLLVEGKDISFVAKEMEHYGWSPEGNPSLPAYLNKNMETIALLLNSKGVINKIPEPLPQFVKR